MITYDISAIARIDLLGIEDYTARRWGEDQARRYIAAIYAAFDRLALDPAIGRTRPSIPAGLRIYKVGSHYIAYGVSAAGRVEVVRLLHQSMNFAARFADRS